MINLRTLSVNRAPVSHSRQWCNYNIITSCLMVASSSTTVSIICCILDITSATAFSILLSASALNDGTGLSSVFVTVTGRDCGTSVGGRVPASAGVTRELSVFVTGRDCGTSVGDRVPASAGVTRELCRKLAGRRSADEPSSWDNHSTWTKWITEHSSSRSQLNSSLFKTSIAERLKEIQLSKGQNPLHQ